MNMKPLSDRVLVKREEKESKTKGGILLPENTQKTSTKGEVVAVGLGKLLESGNRSIMETKVGDKVLVSTYGGTEVKILDEEYLVISESEILAIINN